MGEGLSSAWRKGNALQYFFVALFCFLITDNLFAQCSITNAAITDVYCDNKGTADPSDDDFYFDVTASGTNVGSVVKICPAENDYNGDPSSVSIVFQPLFGSATLSGGCIFYTPDPNVTSGEDQLTYNICHENNATDCTNVEIFIGIGNANTDFYVCEDYLEIPSGTNSCFDLDVLANDVNADPNDVTIILNPPSGNTSESGGIVTYCPSSNFQGVAEVLVSVGSAVDGTSSQYKVTFIVGNPSGLLATRDCFFYDPPNGGTYTISGDVSQAGNGYGMPIALGPFPRSGGSANILLSDDGETCTRNVSVDPPTIDPNLNASTLVLTCTNPTANLSANAGNGFTYFWDVPGNGNLIQQNSITASNPGTYTVYAVDNANDCVGEESVTITENRTPPSASASGGEISCDDPNVQLNGSSNTAGVSYSWDGPGNFSSSQQNPTTTQTGTYTLTVEGPNGCTSTASTSVTGNTTAPNASAIGGTLTCNGTSVQLDGSSNTNGSTFSWSGPGGFNSSLEDPTVTNAGTYTLTVTAPNGCTDTATTSVNEDGNEPGANATGAELSCDQTSVLILGSSPSNNVTYSWSGPGGFSSSTQNPTVVTAGSYTLTVEGNNGCTSTATAIVSENTTPPGASASGGEISCDDPNVQLNGSSNTAGVSYSWDGPGNFSSSQQNPTTTQTGTYTLTVEGPNGCTSTASTSVTGNTSAPIASAIGGTLTCNGTSVQLDGSSNTNGSTFSWSGPGGFNSSSEDPTVTNAGSYTLTVTAPNGCIDTATTSVNEDGNEPGANATGAELSCDQTSVLILGSSPSNNVTYSWSGPEGFSSSTQNPTVATAGSYTLTVEGNNGCTSTATAIVTEDDAQPNASATGGTIDCDQTSVQIFGSSTTNGASYSWSGPGGFSSTSQNPFVTAAGTYTLTVEGPNGCTNTANAEVDENSEVPDVSATGATIFCGQADAQISASSNTAGVSYTWSGPGGFTSMSPSPTVSDAGTYTVTVVAPNGCDATATAEVVNDSSTPVATATGGLLDCNNTTVQIDGSSDTAGSSYSWTGPGGFSTTTQNPTVNTAGTYTLTVEGPNGCTDETTTEVTEDTSPPQLTADGGGLGCAQATTQLTASSNDAGVSYSWSGPGGFNTTTQNPTVNQPGDYTVTAEGSNGCTSMETLTVLDDSTLPNAMATGAEINCLNTTVQLTGTSTTAGVTYSWSGPGGFSTITQNPTVAVAGTYTLTVEAPNGCTETATAEVTEDVAEPDVTATGGEISCAANTTQISASSNTAGVSYSWIGPGGFSSTTQNPTVAETGDYTVTVTGTNGCTVEETVEVLADDLLPDATADGGTLDCTNTTVQLMASSTTAGVSYSWSGPGGFSTTTQNPTVSTPGSYTLTVESGNTCTALATATVIEDVTAPDVSATDGQLGCTQMMVTILAASNTDGVTFTWSGPAGFTALGASATVAAAGTYTVTALAPNGCTETADATVTEDSDTPSAIASGGELDCTTTEIQLSGSSDDATATFAWTGPGGFSSIDQNPTVSTAGTYTLTVTGGNSCTSMTTAEVTEDTDVPDATANGGEITCGQTDIEISGSSTTNGVSYSWTGPGGFASSIQNPIVSEVGIYELTVTAANGCTATAEAEVTADADAPEAMATGGAIDCNNTSIELAGSSATAGVSYSWSGPAGFTSSIQTPSVTTAGTYTLTVEAVNGCTATAAAVVEEDIATPDVAVTDGALGCTQTTTDLTASSNTAGVSYSWTGPAGFTDAGATVTVSEAGTYTVTATAANGCTDTADATVTQDSDTPSAIASGGQLDCTITEIQLFGSSDDPAATFAWTGPAGFSSSDANPFVTTAGTYSLTVTGDNSCTSMATAEVTEDVLNPDVTATGGEITCGTTSTTITATSLTDGVSYSWSGPGGFTSMSQDATASEVGTYTVTVVASNGCEATATVDVAADDAAPDAMATGGTLDCNNTAIELAGSSTTAGVSYSWSGPGGFASTTQNPTVTTPGSYTLTVEAPNGCAAMTSAIVEDDTSQPGALATGGSLDCATGEFTLMGSSVTPGVTYSWTGPAGFSSTLQNPVVNAAGSYNLTTTGPNGCTSILAVANVSLGDCCGLSTAGITAITCANSGTDNITSDDTFTFSVNPINNGGSTYSISGDVMAVGLSYGAAGGPFGPFPISGGTLNITITDDTDQTCVLVNVPVLAPATCSDAGPNGGDVPTLSEWALMVLALLFLNFGLLQTVFASQLSVVLQGSNDRKLMSRLSALPFNKNIMLHAFALVAVLIFTGWTASMVYYGYVAAPDVFGALIAAPLAAYLLHLLILSGKEQN